MKKRKNLYVSMSTTEKVLGWCWLAFQLLLLPSVLTWVNGQLNSPMNGAVYNFVYHLVNFVAMLCIFRLFLRDSLVAAWGDIWNFIQAVVLGFVAYWACEKAYGWILSLLDLRLNNINDSTVAAMLQSNRVLMTIAVVVLAPLTEETLYRGLIFRNLWQTSRVGAYLVSMFAFAAIHVVGYIGTTDITTLILCFIQYLPAGLCLAWTYSKASNLFAPVLVHAIVNAIAIGLVR